uniref:Uncharacterized protein n=1 Tax=Rhabditophanes sp. KR3021 TaxID=114890 RepID=A0AC35UF52_9BILA
MQTRVTFTERLISNINDDINRIEVAIENRFIEIRNGLLQFRANRTLLQNLLLEYPIATYIALFVLFTSISTLLFTVFWINKTKHLVKKFAKDKNIISASSVNKESGKESNKESSSPTFKRSILQYCSFLNKPQKETNKKESKIERQAEKQDYTRVKNESNQAKRENLSEDDRKKKFKVPVPPPSEFHEAPGLENFSEWNIAIHSNGSNLRKKKNE